MRLAVFSDIHGNLQALTKILEVVKSYSVDQTVIVGDLIGIGPQSKECLDLVMNRNVKLILGNHEQYFLDNYCGGEHTPHGEFKQREWINNSLTDHHKDYLKKCPYEIEYEIEGITVLVTHYAGKEGKFEKTSKENQPKELIRLFPKMELVVFGHNHKGGVIKTTDTTFVNLKSSGCTTDNETYYTLVTISQAGYLVEEKSVTYDREGFEQVHQQTDYPNKKVTGPLFFNITK